MRTILRLAAQALLGHRRGLVMLILPACLVVLAVVLRLVTGTAGGFDPVVYDLGLTLALPLVALLASSAVLGPEIDDGSIVYLLAKPVSRHRIVLAKYAVAVLATLGFGAAPLLVAGLLSDPSHPGRAVAGLLAGILASIAYAALFIALATLTRHAVVYGLLFVLLWEGLLGGLFAGIRWLSVGQWARQVAASAWSGTLLTDGVGLTYALVASGVVVVAALWFAGERLRSFTLKGED